MSGNENEPGDLKTREQNPNAEDLEQEFRDDFSGTERERLNNLSDAVGGKKDGNWNVALNKKGKPSMGGRLSTAKKLWLGGGGAMVIISAMFAIFSFISPFKANHIISSIESRVGEVPQNAVEHRLTYYMARYLMLRAAIKADASFERDRAYTYIGNGVFSTLYTNWKGANLEAKLETEYNMRLRPNRAVGQLIGRDLVKPQNWSIEILDSNGKVISSRTVTSDREMRREFRDFSRKETKSYQVFKRYQMRKVLKRYYAVNNWKPFEKTQRIIEDKYLERKLAFKKWVVKQTIGRFSSKYTAYLNCLLEGGDKCKQEHLNPPDQVANAPDGETGRAIDDSSNSTSSQLSKTLQQMGLKRVMTSVAGGGVLTVLEIFGAVQAAVATGALSAIAYDNISQQYAGYSTAIQSASDQIKSGEDFEHEDARILAETFDGYESSPVYTQGIDDGTVAAAAQYMRDCDDDGTKETTLEPGETVCPNKKLIQDKEGIKRLAFWPVIDAVGSFYNGVIGKPVQWASDLFSIVLSTVGVTALMSKIMEVSGLSTAAAPLLEQGMNWIVGFSVTGAETGEAAYDAVYAGIFVRNSAVGSTIGGSREGTIGGAPLTNDQVRAIKAEDKAFEQYVLSKKSLAERYLSPDVQSSLTSYAIMHTPTKVTTMSSSFLGAINPASIISKFGSLLTPRSYAAAGDANFNNPFGGIYMGYSNTHPALEMEEDELNATYQCHLPADERPQNKAYGRPDGMPFDTFVETDPCLLNEAVGNAGGKFFDGSFNEL